jgi:hypothetical protein
MGQRREQRQNQRVGKGPRTQHMSTYINVGVNVCLTQKQSVHIKDDVRHWLELLHVAGHGGQVQQNGKRCWAMTQNGRSITRHEQYHQVKSPDSDKFAVNDVPKT